MVTYGTITKSFDKERVDKIMTRQVDLSNGEPDKEVPNCLFTLVGLFSDLVTNFPTDVTTFR